MLESAKVMTMPQKIITPSRLAEVKKDFKKRKLVYLMILPILAYYILSHYWPMYGAVIAFKSFSPSKGILGSEWIGFRGISRISSEAITFSG